MNEADDPNAARVRHDTGATCAWRDWLASAPGRYALEWQQVHFDAAVADVFGYHALQCGMPELNALRDNRMPHRIQAGQCDARTARLGVDLLVEHFEELPLATQSLDLVVLPHVLEFAVDPHQVLREVDRVLRPEGRVIVSGFNPVSLWGVRQWYARSLSLEPFLPHDGQFIGLPRLRDWFKLLSFDFDRGRYGCYRPPCRTQKWLDRTRFMEAAGDRWWPICGAIYLVSAIKRMRALRLVGPVRRAVLPKHVPVAIAAPQRVAATSESESTTRTM